MRDEARLFTTKLIGLAGGLARAKSYIAALFAEIGCAVWSTRQAVEQLYKRPQQSFWLVVQTLRDGGADGGSTRRAVDRKAGFARGACLPTG